SLWYRIMAKSWSIISNPLEELPKLLRFVFVGQPRDFRGIQNVVSKLCAITAIEVVFSRISFARINYCLHRVIFRRRGPYPHDLRSNTWMILAIVKNSTVIIATKD